MMSSVPEEGKLLIKRLGKGSSIAGKALYQGSIDDMEVVYIISGIGKTNSAHAATILLERFSPEFVILFGVGGAYPFSGLGIGDIAIAEEEIYGDEGVRDGKGFHGTELIGIPLLKQGRKRYFNRLPLDKTFVTEAVESSKKLVTRHASRVTGVKAGVFVTVSTCTGTRKRALELRRKYRAICENMEGASIAHVCAMYGTPMIEIRGISNIVEDRDRKKWNVKLAAENCQRMILELLERYGKPY